MSLLLPVDFSGGRRVYHAGQQVRSPVQGAEGVEGRPEGGLDQGHGD